MKKILYLIDGTAYIHRAYHAIHGLSSSKGLPTNAVFGFTRMLIKLMEERSPEFAVMVFDARGPTFRHEIFSDYKANRPPMPEDMSVQIPYIKEISRAYNLPVLEMPGYEADDIIGTLSRMAQEQGFEVVMVTGDKDFMQLVTEKSTIWDPMKDKTIDLKEIQKTFGVEPAQMVEVMGLSGDVSDNIPGVHGIGQKTALTLIQEFGSIENLYNRIDEIPRKKQKENLIQAKELALLSRKLVTIDTTVPLPFEPESFKLQAPDGERLSGLFQELEFRQLQQSVSRPADLKDKRYRAIQDENDLAGLIDRLESSVLFALDTETTDIDPMKARLVGLSFSLQPEEAFYIPVGHDDPQVQQLEMKTVLNRLGPVLKNPDIGKVGQNIKYDWIVLARNGVSLEGVVFDTMLASYLINPSKRAHNLDQIALDFLDHKTITYEDVAGKGKSAVGFNAVSLEKAVPYACEDADVTLAAFRVLSGKLSEMGLDELMRNVEMPLVPVLMRMEMQGIRVDVKGLRDLSKSFEHQLEQIETSIYSMCGERFNIKSSQQIGEILFEKLGLPVQKKTRKKTGYSTDMEVLTELAHRHELPAMILNHRTLAKLKSTYADALVELVHPQTGRIHTSFNQTVTATGRLSSSDPNLQNIPIRTEEGRRIRSMFIPREGWQMISADYSQIELRIFAHCSEDPILIKAFQDDEDIHVRTAAEVFQVFPSMITPELRRQAKVINFGIIYGMSPFGLSKALDISQIMAKKYIDNYFSRYQGVKNFIDRTIAESRKTGRTSTLLGRIRLLPDINSSNRNLRQFAERTAVNTPIQGTAADLIKLAMIQVDADLREKKLQTAMLLSVHDELVFESPPEEVDTVKEMVVRIMENIWNLKAPLKVNVATGNNWAEAH